MTDTVNTEQSAAPIGVVWAVGMVAKTAEQKASQNRKVTRDGRFKEAASLRAHWTADELAAEEQRLIEEAAILAASMGLHDECIGRRWGHKVDELDRTSNGQLPVIQEERTSSLSEGLPL